MRWRKEYREIENLVVNGRESVEGGLKRNLKKKEREILKKIKNP